MDEQLEEEDKDQTTTFVMNLDDDQDDKNMLEI